MLTPLQFQSDPQHPNLRGVDRQCRFNLTHNIPINTGWIGNAVGDKIGLYPHAYLHRYLHYSGNDRLEPLQSHASPPKGYNSSADLAVAKRTVDDYILTWPVPSDFSHILDLFPSRCRFYVALDGMPITFFGSFSGTFPVLQGKLYICGHNFNHIHDNT
jgi:hypothetical protein